MSGSHGSAADSLVGCPDTTQLEHDFAQPTFSEMWGTLLFVAAIWVVGKIFSRLGMPTLIGEIVVGCLMGPHMWDVVPEHRALMLYGEVGLMLLVLEAGLDVDVEMLRLIGARGVGVAVSGSAMPLCIAASLSIAVCGLDWKVSHPSGPARRAPHATRTGRPRHSRPHPPLPRLQAALAVGCTLAPTSMGIALNVLKRGKVPNTHVTAT